MTFSGIEPGDREQFVVDSPAGPPTAPLPVIEVDDDEYVGTSPPDRSGGLIAAIIVVGLLVLAGLLIWLATRSSEVSAPSATTVPAAATSTLPASSPPATAASTAPPVAITAPPARSPTTQAPASTVAPGNAAALGDGLTMVVTNFAPNGSSTLQAPSGGAPPPPAAGSRYAVVSVSLTNRTGAPIDPGTVELRLVSRSTSGTFAPSSTVTTNTPLDLGQAVDPGQGETGDIVFDVPSTAFSDLQLRAATPAGSIFFGL